EAAREGDCLISIDPNIRLHLWPSCERARDACLGLADDAAIYKVNDEELEVMAPGQTPDQAWREVFEPRGVDLFVVTLGEEGAVGFTREGRCAVDAPTVDVLDTTGAGDGFMSGFLAGLAAEFAGDDWRRRLPELRSETLVPILELGCHIGSRVCTTLGATPPLPERGDLADRFVELLERDDEAE
ncbi:MAG: carbohydrate kinase family protein, partial [Bradymonadaceae bacterium]